MQMILLLLFQTNCYHSSLLSIHLLKHCFCQCLIRKAGTYYRALNRRILNWKLGTNVIKVQAGNNQASLCSNCRKQRLLQENCITEFPKCLCCGSCRSTRDCQRVCNQAARTVTNPESGKEIWKMQLLTTNPSNLEPAIKVQVWHRDRRVRI